MRRYNEAIRRCGLECKNRCTSTTTFTAMHLECIAKTRTRSERKHDFFCHTAEKIPTGRTDEKRLCGRSPRLDQKRNLDMDHQRFQAHA